MARIQIFLPDDNVLTHELVEDTVRVGRAADNDLQIDDPSVSSHHGEILFKDGNYILKDLGSTNGTTVNNSPAAEEHILTEGDRIVFGHVDALFGEEISLAADSTGVPPQELAATAPAAASGISARPIDFVSSSPIPKVVIKKDPIRATALVIAAISILLSLAAIVSAIVVIQTPTFPAP